MAVEETPGYQRIVRNELSVPQGMTSMSRPGRSWIIVGGGGLVDRAKRFRRQSLQLWVTGFSTALGHAYLLLEWILGLWEKLHCMK